MLGYALEWRDKHIIAGPLLLEPMNSVKECVHTQSWHTLVEVDQEKVF